MFCIYVQEKVKQERLSNFCLLESRMAGKGMKGGKEKPEGGLSTEPLKRIAKNDMKMTEERYLK